MGVDIAALLDELAEDIENKRPIIQAIPCGWALLDETVGGLIRGEFLGLIGGPGTGKSTLADSIIVNALVGNPGTKAIIFALETAPKVRIARLVAGRSVRIGPSNELMDCIPVKAFLNGTLENVGKERALRSKTALREAVAGRISFQDKASLVSEIARVISDECPDIVLVDHLGLVVSDLASDSEVSRFDVALGTLIAAIRKTNTAAIFINELSKSALATDKADMAASRGSVRFSSLAAIFVGLTQERTSEGEPTVTATLAKNRFGTKGLQQQAQFFGGYAYFDWGKVEQENTK